MERPNKTKAIFNYPLPPAVLTVLLAAVSVCSQGLSVKTGYQTGDFKLVYQNKAADILVSPSDFRVVQIAANDLASDVESVTGNRPGVVNEASKDSQDVVIVGTLGKCPLIDSLAKSGRLDVTAIRGKWESYLMAAVKNPLPNVQNALVIIGSDRRGTAYGIYEMSQMIGVSPWHWWADVVPEHKNDLLVSTGKKIGREPSVKYRGIFINDEDWGLQPWAAKTYEPETGDIGPKTYAKVCELLLRLKANTLWPAMHEVTRAFNTFRENPKVADDYAIVMGSSHAEPMLRSNTTEWKTNKDDYNFVTNPAGVTAYWEERARENGRFENIFTLGMRGIHDSAIVGPKTQAERIPLLEKIFSVQRGLIGKYVRPDVENVPQIFCPYKEVLADYRAGLKVPDDVTIVFPDDNFGYIRQFPSAEEQKRKGGFGVYYHISYLGRPISYVWLNSTPPALVFEEMSKAYNNGMRQLWIVNVGDIKPGEIGMEFFLQMAYDANRWNLGNIDQYLETWARREFGEQNSDVIAAIMDKYYRLGFQRKPEHLQWYIPGEKPHQSDLTETETLERLDAYTDIRKRADVVYEKIPRAKKDAFYELVVYPVRSAALANERFFAAELAERHRANRQKDARFLAERSIQADQSIAKETKYFNETLASGKWRYIMSPEMNAGQWTSMRSTPTHLSLDDFPVDDSLSMPLAPTPVDPNKPVPGNLAARGSFFENDGTISIEAENFTSHDDRSRAGWMVIHGLGKTGDTVSVFPNTAKSFTDMSATSPSLGYQINVENSADYAINVYLVPTQPLIPGNGLRIAFSIDGGQPQVVTVDDKTEVSSVKWSQNILNETTVGTGSVHLTAGKHTLHIFAVDTGIVLDKIVLHSHDLAPSYFGPPETLKH